MIRLEHGLRTLGLCALVLLLQPREAGAQMAANGSTLTVTTANAVATFKGADLVGFANVLTGETYLKHPSNGDLARVDAISATGQLQVSNWTIAPEPGTGVPLASITAGDSARAFSMAVKIDPATLEIVVRSSATVTAGGVRGAGWTIAGLDLATGRWIVPAKSGVVFDRTHLGLDTYLQYPFSWHAQMAVYEGSQGSFLLYSTDTNYAFKQLRQTSRADYMVDVGVFTEAEAPWTSASSVPAVEWRIKAYSGNWRVAAATFRSWMLATRPPLSKAAYPWVANIRTVIGISSATQDQSLLAPLAAQVTPAQTLLYLVDWRQYGYDINYPDYTPAPNTAAFIAAAHALGFKVMLHTDLVGVTPDNPDYALVQAHQTRTSETLEPMGWLWDRPPSTPQRFATINPASAAFRALFIARIGAAIAAVNPDALHLDFNGIYNDGNGRIGGLTFAQGSVQLHSEMVSAFPQIALAGELQSDIDYRFYAFAQAGLDMAFVPAPGHPIVTFLFSPHTLTYGHLSTPHITGGGTVTPSMTNGRFKAALVENQRRGVLPLRHVDWAGDLDTAEANIGRFVAMTRRWQDNALQPAWTADWTGALIRYEGSGGATAALTDTGQLLSLATPQSPMFQIAHDATQLATTSFISRWPAFDGSTLYGLNPANLYYVDPLPRPNATHATSLPAGVHVGTATRVSTAFAHLQLEGGASFDFNNLTLPHARAGVRYQGTDYPRANGAEARMQNTTVGGVTRSGLFIHPPWQAQIGGETFVEYSVPVPASGGVLRFSVGIDDDAACTDGVSFRVAVAGIDIWARDLTRGTWHDGVVSLTAYAGTTVPLRLISHPGAAANASCDWSSWSQLALAAPAVAISVPMTLITGASFSGIDGAAYAPGSSSSGTVTATAPGAFTIFTQPGPAVGPGTNLTAVPFEVWQWITGELAHPGTIFGAGSVGTQSAGGVLKTAAIFAHPPYPGRTVLSWVVRLPASPLRLQWSAGVMDGANSSDGVDFEVRVNGQPYWRMTDGAHGVHRWTAGTLDLSRWAGQSILLELTTDSRGDINFDWAAWADLVLSGSGAACAYGVPASAAVDMMGATLVANVTAPASCPWSATSHAPWLTVTAGSGSGNGSVTYVAAPNPGEARTGTLTIAGQTLTVTQSAAPPAILPEMTLDRRTLIFGGVSNGVSFLSQTGPQLVRLTQRGAGTVSWTARSNAPWLVVSPTSGSGSATLTVSVEFAGGLSASQTGAVVLTFTGAGNASAPVDVTLTTIPTGVSAAPIGSFDTPIDGTTGIAGSFAVTGWALDDVAVTSVTICRSLVIGETIGPDGRCNGLGQIFIGNALFVEGARSDVHAAYPATPLSSRAGWGYLLLSNFLPNLGNGTFTLWAYASDVDGHTTTLGSKTISCNNAASTAPFGAIDTPDQGGVVDGGSYINFGWALAPAGHFANVPDGATVTVLIDGIPRGTPAGWVARSDLTELFPAADYPGVSRAAAAFTFDTTTLANGVHTIAWIVRTNTGEAAGIGSRYFSVSNGNLRLDPNHQAALSSVPVAIESAIVRAPADPGPISGRLGFDTDRPLRPLVSVAGVAAVHSEELTRLELQLGSAGGHHYTGYMRTPDGLAPLPVGSTLNAATGAFHWMPGPGFVGSYRLVFVRWSGGTAIARQDVRIVLNAKGSTGGR